MPVFAVAVIAAGCGQQTGPRASSSDRNRISPEVGLAASLRHHQRNHLGARNASLIRLVLADALKTGVIGCAIGIVAALLLARWVEPLLYDADPRSPLLLGLAALAVLVVSALAALAPAIRATRVDPAVALRTDWTTTPFYRPSADRSARPCP